MTRAINESSRQFLRGAASYFGLPEDQLIAGTVGDSGEAMEVTLTLSLTLTDLVGIVKRAEEKEQERASQALDDFLGKPRAGMSAEQSAAFDAEGLTGTWRGSHVAYRAQNGEGSDLRQPQAEESSEGVGGRKVVHVDAPEEQADAGLPASVWVAGAYMQEGQAALASDYSARTDTYLMQVALLTDGQRALYGVQS